MQNKLSRFFAVSLCVALASLAGATIRVPVKSYPFTAPQSPILFSPENANATNHTPWFQLLNSIIQNGPGHPDYEDAKALIRGGGDGATSDALVAQMHRDAAVAAGRPGILGQEARGVLGLWHRLRKTRGLVPALRFAGRLAGWGSVGYAVWTITQNRADGGSHTEKRIIYGQSAPALPAGQTWEERWYFGGSFYRYQIIDTPTIVAAGCEASPTTYTASTGVWSGDTGGAGCGANNVNSVGDWGWSTRVFNTPSYCTANPSTCFGTEFQGGPGGSNPPVSYYVAAMQYALDRIASPTLPGATIATSTAPIGLCTTNDVPSGSGNCVYRRASEDEMMQKFHVVPLPTDNTTPATATTTFAQPAVTETLLDGFLQDLLDSQDENAETLRQWIAWQIDKDNASTQQSDPFNEPITVPDCTAKSVETCVSLLRNLGWTGSAVVVEVDEGSAVPQYGPGAVISTSPAKNTTISPGISITILVNPSDLPIPFPPPGLNETYDNYIARLRALGWLGTATTELLAEDDPLVGPEAVSHIIIAPGTATETIVYTTLWPFPRPMVRVNTEVKLKVNSAAAPPVGSTTGTGPFEEVPVPNKDDTCGPTVPSVNLAPLSPGVTEKFPFGLFVYAKDTISALVATAVPPEWNITISAGQAGSGTINLDLAPLDPYVDIVRMLLTIALWLAAIFMLASSFLGLRSGSAGGGLDGNEYGEND